MKDTYYFRHDYNSRNDLRMQALIEDHGAVGYGLFWSIIEILHEEEAHSLPLSVMIYKAIGKQMSTNVEQVEQVVKSCLSYGLFIQNGDEFYSERVNENIKIRDGISDSRSKAGKESAKRRANSTRVEQKLTHVEQKPTNKRKEKEIKENKEIYKESPQLDFPKQKKEISDPPPSPPPSKPYLVLGYDQALEELLSSDSWIISTALASKLSEDQVKQKVREFISREASANPDTPPIFNELRRHCSYWIQGKFYEPKNGPKPPEKITAPSVKNDPPPREVLDNESKLFLLEHTGRMIRFKDELTQDNQEALRSYWASKSAGKQPTTIQDLANKLTREK